MNEQVSSRSPGHAPHIAFVINNYPPKIGGVESHVSQLAEHLVLAGARVSVITLDNHTPSGTENGVRIHRFRCTPAIGDVLALPYPGTSRKLRHLLRTEGVSVVSTHTRFFPMSYLGVRAARALGLPSIHTEHGADFVRSVGQFVSLASRIVDLTLGRYVLRHSTLVLGVSDPVNQFVRRLARVPSTTFHNGIIASLFQDIPSEHRLEPNATRHRLVFVGRLVEGKGWDKVLRIAETLAPDFPDLQVHFIGEGPSGERLAQLVESSPARDRTTVHGRLGQAEIAVILQNAVLVNASTLAEGFQTTILEAVACRAAVVSTPVPSAVVLHEMGANVLIVATAGDDEWSATVRQALESERMPTDDVVLGFDWRNRARVYLGHIAEATSRKSRSATDV